ncbi:hypothetical protein Cgig2_034139 [Carnegiea gigantea]|uniref:Uncharacterized protein n=1 Tax=Carnegiea gigantea TaxID=171969 RepID=A0A9Q1KF96_9CARY|nr:hypothetical protein Cgig2_034139 [Carnegiea gigantea]
MLSTVDCKFVDKEIYYLLAIPSKAKQIPFCSALGQAASNFAAIGKGRAAVANIISIMDSKGNPTKISEAGVMLPAIEGEIEFREVHFSYPSQPKLLFEGLSFTVAAGKTFAIVGPSGSRKSTIMSMIQRFYDPSSGSILLGGHNLRDLQLKWLREQMGFVNQEPTLFATTIAENTLCGKEAASMERVVDAAKAANAHSFIQSLPDGCHTQVGGGGTQLSGGQKQTIAIARALIRDLKILLLDEATSALDAESEFVVQKAVDKVLSNRTTIFVAHRLSTIRDVDCIIDLCNGHVIECGTHIELTSKKGQSAALVSLQASDNGDNLTTKGYEQSSVVLSWSKSSNSIQPSQDFITPSNLGKNSIALRRGKHTPILSNEAGWFDYEQNSIGSLTSKLAAAATLVRTALVDRLSVILQNTALAVTAFVIAFKLSWRMAAVTIAMYPLLIGAAIAEVLAMAHRSSFVSVHMQSPSVFAVAEALALTPEIVKGSEALGSVFSILKRKAVIDSDDPESTIVTDIKGDVEFKDLSAGQKQRVAIARAILKDLSILLLDEATSTLDSSSEKAVQDTLVKLMRGRTTIIVAHRLSNICDADRIAVMWQGKVAEIGNHKELLCRPGSIYAQLVRLQQENKQSVS